MIRWSEYAVAPILTHVDVSYNELKLTFSQDLKNSNTYSINDFVVNYNDSPVTLKDVYVSNKKLIIHLPDSIATKHPSPSIEDPVTSITIADLVMENTYSKWVVTNDISEVDVSGVIFPYDLELISNNDVSGSVNHWYYENGGQRWDAYDKWMTNYTVTSSSSRYSSSDDGAGVYSYKIIKYNQQLLLDFSKKPTY